MAIMTHHTTSSTTVNTTCTTPPSEMRPPTYNQLDAAQRSRLIKSSRKLGKVLGTTPCVLETLPSLPTLSSKTSMTDISAKRRSAPPTPTGNLGEFISQLGSTLYDDPSRKPSYSSALSEDESKSSSSHTHLPPSPSSSSLHHKKASSDTLGPIPAFPGSETSRHKSKRLQPVIRLPPVTATHAVPASPSPNSPSSLFPPDYKLQPTKYVDPSLTPLPLSPTTSVSPSSTEMPPTPSSVPLDPFGDTSPTLPDDVLAYPGLGALKDVEADESRLRKRRMEKLMRHLGECVPSELVFGSTRRRDAKSFSASLVSPTQERADSGTVSGIIKDAQTRVMRRVSVISGQRRRTHPDETETMNSGCLSDPEPGNAARIHAVLMREKSKIHIQRGERRAKEKPLVEDEWTPEAYEDVVKRLRRLK